MVVLGAEHCEFSGEFRAAKLDRFGLRGKPEFLKERSRNLRRAGEFFSSKRLAGRQREREIAGMWRRRVHDLKILH